MDEFLEQMLFASPWADGAGMINSAYDAMPTMPMTGMPVESIAALQGFAKASCNHLTRAIENQESLKDGNSECRGVGDQSHNLQTLPAMTPAWMASTSGHMRSDPGERTCINTIPRDDEVMALQNVHHQGQGQASGDHSHSGKSPGGPAKPRVRARRGQATDPHSIAERNRRERIAERMKALQELVPDSNKTDKTSMLDEIIGYVKFLQMQVKCLSMCRLGGAGAAAPLLADLPVEGAASFIAANLVQANGAPGPSQEGVASSERQVATLMDEDMSAAMQYLQSKGLCLMPISLATAISSTGARMQQPPQPKGSSDPAGNEKKSMDSADTRADSSNVPGVPLANDASGMVVNDGHMMPTTKKPSGTVCSIKAGMK